MTNQKGLIVLAIPLTIAILGLIGTGALATFDHEKSLVKQRDEQRAADIAMAQEELKNYFIGRQQYPLQKDEAINGWQILKNSINNLPDDPLANKGWSYAYWSDGKSYTVRYMLEQTSVEQVVFSN